MTNIEKVIDLVKDINKDITYNKIEKEIKIINGTYSYSKEETHYTVVLKFKN